jgi:hypothetical protein
VQVEPSSSRGLPLRTSYPPCCCRRPAGPAATGVPGSGLNSCSSTSVAVTVQLSTWHTTRLEAALRVYLVARPPRQRQPGGERPEGREGGGAAGERGYHMWEAPPPPKCSKASPTPPCTCRPSCQINTNPHILPSSEPRPRPVQPIAQAPPGGLQLLRARRICPQPPHAQHLDFWAQKEGRQERQVPKEQGGSMPLAAVGHAPEAPLCAVGR